MDAKHTWLSSEELSSRWDEAVNALSSDIPDGRYVLGLEDCDIVLSQGGNPMIVWRWKVLEGEYKGCTVTDFDGLTGERSMEFVVRKLDTLGAQLKGRRVSDLPEILRELAETRPAASCRVRTSGNFRNVSVDSLVATSHAERSKLTARIPSTYDTYSPPEEGDPFAEPDDEVEEAMKQLSLEGTNDMEADEEGEMEEEQSIPQVGDKVLLKSGKIGAVLGFDPSTQRITVRVEGKLRSVRMDDVEGIVVDEG